MRIFLFHYYNAIANPAYTQISNALRNLGHEVTVAYRNENNDLMLDRGGSQKLGVTAPRLNPGKGLLAALQNKLSLLFFALKIRALIQRESPDVAQINRANVSWFWVLPLFPHETKYVLDCRQVAVSTPAPSPIGRFRQWFRRRFHLFAIQYLFHKASYLHVRGAEKELGQSWQNNGMVVPLGVGDAFLAQQPKSGTTTRPHNKPFSFIYIGSITRIRKLEVLIEAAKQLKEKSNKPFQLVFAGPDNTGGYYQNQVNQWKLQDTVRFLGAVKYDEIPHLLSQHPIALAYVPDEPQDWVYQPTLKILEYHALGIPVLASDVPPNRDIIDQNQNGLVVGNSPSDWQQGMEQLLEDQKLYQSVSNHAKNNRHGESWQNVAKLYVEQYQKMS